MQRARESLRGEGLGVPAVPPSEARAGRSANCAAWDTPWFLLLVSHGKQEAKWQTGYFALILWQFPHPGKEMVNACKASPGGADSSVLHKQEPEPPPASCRTPRFASTDHTTSTLPGFQYLQRSAEPLQHLENAEINLARK